MQCLTAPVCIVVVHAYLMSAAFSWKVPDNVYETFYGTTKKEHAGVQLKTKGSIPKWLNGYFLHQSCGSFGNNSSDPGSKILHIFDCIGSVTSFDFNKGRVDYSHRFYRTRPFKIWDYYERDMDKSKVAWMTAYSEIDQDQYKKWSPLQDYPVLNPNVAFWKIGDKVAAVTDNPSGYWFDLHTLESKGIFPFKDVNFGFSHSMVPVNNPAHEHVDEDGVTLYSSVSMYDISDFDNVNVIRVIYKIVNETRVRIASFQEAGPFNLNHCYFDSTYPLMTTRGSYLHSFCMTENHFVLPMSTFLYDKCSLFRVNDRDGPEVPLYSTIMKYSEDVPTRFVVVSRRTNEVVGEFTTEDGLFITHQLNSYEENGIMYLDMLTYRGDIYEHMHLDKLLTTPNFVTRVERFLVDMSDWTLLDRIDLLPNSKYSLVEFPTMNYEVYNTKPYNYTYMVGFDPIPNVLIKLNVQTNETLYWGPFEGLIPGEPVFVARPDSTAEDDGVIISTVLDTNVKKGMVVVLDAQTFTEIGRAVSPELMPFGQHSKFIRQSATGSTRNVVQRVAFGMISVLSPVVLLAISLGRNIVVYLS
ncbi:beta,beta-carotene 15,15'-dioxygenase-like [Ptychodera flava]|uniref:beta,beta-carotene 15,15'-dioxygenase-like n=1 Tax=Ptychodera flava TaxID=63121 RepID=UPI00396A14E3